MATLGGAPATATGSAGALLAVSRLVHSQNWQRPAAGELAAAIPSLRTQVGRIFGVGPELERVGLDLFAAPGTFLQRDGRRLTGDGIAGAKIVADVDGPAELVPQNSVVSVKNGYVLLGKDNVEFVIRPSGPGKVKVKITSTFLKNEPTVTDYEFEVK